MFAWSPNKVNFARIERQEYEDGVEPHAAFDLAELDELRRSGKPISAANAVNDYYEGSAGPTSTMDPLERRGVDINDAYELSMNARTQLKKARTRAVDIKPV